MKPTAPTPDMTRENRAELKDIHDQMAALDKGIRRRNTVFDQKASKAIKARMRAIKAKTNLKAALAAAKAAEADYRAAGKQQRASLRDERTYAALEKRSDILVQRPH